jgi:hypothetical protein
MKIRSKNELNGKHLWNWYGRETREFIIILLLLVILCALSSGSASPTTAVVKSDLPEDADVSVVRECYPLVPGKAQQVIFEDTVINNGPSPAMLVQLSNNLAETNPPGGFSNFSISLTYDDEGHWTKWYNASQYAIVQWYKINASKSRTARFRLDVAPNVTSVGDSTVTVNSMTFDPITENNTYNCNNEVIFTDVAVSKT